MKTFKGIKLKSLCAFILALMLMITNITGLVEVKAAGVPAPTINKVFYDATTISGGNVHVDRINKKTVRGTVHVTLKNGDTIKAKLSFTPKSGTKWSVSLPENVKVEPGDVVTAYQEFDGQKSTEVSANAEPSLAYDHKTDLKMPSGDFYLEQFSSNIVSEDEKAEALQMLKDANPSFSDKIESVEFSIKGIEENKKAYYIVNYTDKSKTEEISAPNLKIIKVTEYSRGYTVEPYNVVSTVIKGKLDGEGPFNNIKVQFSAKLSEDGKRNFLNGSCIIDKNSTNFKTIDVNPQTGEFLINVGEKTLEIGAVLGIKIKEPHKFATCNSSVTELVIPKVKVKDPKKLTKEDKEKIADAIRTANTTQGGTSKLPDGNEYTGGIPAVIQIDDSGNVKIFSGSDVKGDWGDNYKFVPETNEDGSYKLKDGSEPKVTFNKPGELISNLAPDAPEINIVEPKEDDDDKTVKVVITPKEVDTDADKVIVTYVNAAGVITTEELNIDPTTKTASLDISNIKKGTTLKASVKDKGFVDAKEEPLTSVEATIDIKDECKVTYNANTGTGDMAGATVKIGAEYTILGNAFNAPDGKEFKAWEVNGTEYKAGDKIKIYQDTEIKALWQFKFAISTDGIETKVNHPVNYEMYKNAIKGVPAGLTVEHIEVKTKPDISNVTTETEKAKAIIEIRFSDGQFKTLEVPVKVVQDPNIDTIKKLEKQVEDKTTEITKLTEEVAKLKKQVEECNKCKTDKEACEKEKQKLQEDIEKQKTEIENKGKEVKKLTDDINKAKDELEKTKTDLGNTKKEAEEKAKKITELDNKVKDLDKKVKDLGDKNEEIKKELETEKKAKEKAEEEKKAAEEAKEKAEKDKKAAEEAKDKAEKEKEQLEKDKKELEEKKEELEKAKQVLEDKNKTLTEENKEKTEKVIKELEEKIKVLEKKVVEKEYIYIREKDTSPADRKTMDKIKTENEKLDKENKELKEKIYELEKSKGCDMNSFKERYVTIFSLDSMLYKTYLEDELLTQAEMNDLRGFITPFISKSRTMLPMRYIALTMGLDVNWNAATRTATFVNNGRYNVLNASQVTVNADTLEMKDQYGNLIAVDSKPVLKDGRFYISITNLIKAFGGSNGDLSDGVGNTIEWDAIGRRVLVYKYVK